MPPVIPAEMISGAIELAVFFLTAVGALLSLMWTARA